MSTAIAPTDFLDDPLSRALVLSFESNEENFRTGVLHLSHQQKRYIHDLQEAQKKATEERSAQENVSTWQKVGRFFEAVFIALGVVAGVCAASAGSSALAVVLITAAIWRISYEVIQALRLGQTIQDALVPQEVKNRDQICSMLSTTATVIDITSRLALALGTGYSAYQMMGQTKNIFQIASLLATGASTGIQVTTGVKKAQAERLKAMAMEHGAYRDFSKRGLDDLRQEVEASSNRAQAHAKTSRSLLDADHQAKQAIYAE
jgi:hypothetical protein